MLNTLRDILTYLDADLDESQKLAIRSLPEDNLINLHFSLGLYIRNAILYPPESAIGQKLINGYGDPDDISVVICKAYWWHLNSKEITKEMMLEAFKENMLSSYKFDNEEDIRLLLGDDLD